MNGLDFIKKIETDCEVNAIRFNRVCVWPLLRRLYLNAYDVKYNKARNINILSGKIPKGRLFRCIFYGIQHVLKLFSSPYFIFSATERRKFIDSYYEDRVVEGLLDITKKKHLLIENPAPIWHHHSLNYLKNKTVISDALLTVLALIIGHAVYLFHSRNGLESLQLIESKYKIKVSYKIYLKRYLGQYYLFKLITFFNRPKACFFVFPGSWFGVIHALKDRKIQVLELQHGIINDEHPAYNYFTKLDQTLLPDYLLTYGYREKKLLSRNIFIKTSNILPVGYYFIDRVKDNLNSKMHFEKFEYSVVFSHQEPFEGQSLTFLKEIASLNKEILFIICPRRITPYLEKFRPLFNENMQIETAMNIYDLLKICDLHCTVTSSTTIEAIAFGKPSILLNVEGKANLYYGTPDYDDYLTIINSANEFSVEFKSILKTKKTSTSDISQFFKPKFNCNIKKVMRFIEEDSDKQIIGL